MKTYTYTVKQANGDIYTGTSTQRILDIRDSMWGRPADCEKIHYSFFEQLTLQISPQIQNALGMKLPKSLQIMCYNGRFVKKGDCFYIEIHLTGKEASSDIWVKCLSPYDAQMFCQRIDAITFQICDTEEAKYCSAVSYFGRTDVGVDWIDYVKHSFTLYAQSNDPSRFESDYPDVILKVRMKSKVTDAIREEVYGMVTRFIQSWNEQADEFSQIHEVQLQDGSPNKYTVCVYIDFASSDPAALEGLFRYMTENNDKIKDIKI